MAVYRTTSCPKCHFIMERRKVAYQAIGQPYTRCPNCGTTLDIRAFSNEWFLMSKDKKMMEYLRAVYTCGLFLAWLPFAAGWAMQGIDKETFNKVFPFGFLIVWPVCAILAGTWRYWQDARLSVGRLFDDKYVKKLVRHGFLTAEESQVLRHKYGNFRP